MGLFLILFSAVFINNFVLSQFLGMCPFLGVSKKIETAVGMGIAVVFVMTISSASTYAAYNFILVHLHIEYLSTIVFILLIAALVQFVEMFLKKSSPTLYSALGVFLPLIATNCAVLGVTLINMQKSYNLIEAVVNGFGGGLGFMLAIVLLAGIREKLDTNTNIPELIKGFPLVLVTAGLMSIAFLGFQGLLQ